MREGQETTDIFLSSSSGQKAWAGLRSLQRLRAGGSGVLPASSSFQDPSCSWAHAHMAPSLLYPDGLPHVCISPLIPIEHYCWVSGPPFLGNLLLRSLTDSVYLFPRKTFVGLGSGCGRVLIPNHTYLIYYSQEFCRVSLFNEHLTGFTVVQVLF